jgi:hypothetical protein
MPSACKARYARETAINTAASRLRRPAKRMTAIYAPVVLISLGPYPFSLPLFFFFRKGRFSMARISAASHYRTNRSAEVSHLSVPLKVQLKS